MNKEGPVFNYNEFSIWMEQLVNTGKTSGLSQTQVLSDFTNLNKRRMSRLDKTTKLLPELTDLLSHLEEPQKWVVITEAWCGDSAQNLPVIAKISEASSNIDLRIILRDENPEWMEKYHTNGSKSIPKLIAFDEKGEELFTWGPRPQPAQDILLEWKLDPRGRNWETFEKELHTWYALDKSSTLQQEFIEIFEKIVKPVLQK